MKRLIRNMVFLYVFLILLFVGLRVLSSMMPHHLVRDNIKRSYSYLEEYPIVGVPEDDWDKTSQLDGVSEFYLLANAMSTTGSEPIKEALGNYQVAGHGSTGLEIMEYLKDISTDETAMENKIYKPTYWWGIQSLMRPLLAVFSYSAAIQILQLTVLILTTVLFYLISNRVGLVEGVLFIFSLWSINIFVVTMSFFFSSTFLAAMGICIYMFFDKNLENNYIYVFGIAGMLTAYFDWLSATTVPLTLPLIVLFLIINKKTPISLKKGIKLGFCSSFVWGGGYLVTIITKWGLADLAGFDVWGNALQRIGNGMEGAPNVDWLPSDPVDLMFASLQGNFEQLRYVAIARYSGRLNIFLLLVLLIVVLAVLFHKKNIFPLYLFIIALYPAVQYAVLKGHDSIHCWFTYRSAVATSWAATLMIYYLFDISKLKKLKFGKKKM